MSYSWWVDAVCELILKYGMAEDKDWVGRQSAGRSGGFALVTYIESPHDPRAGSYKPPRTGFSRVSKVVSFSIFLTDTAWISSLVRNVNSTRSTEDDTGCEMFMMVWDVTALASPLRREDPVGQL